MADDDAVSGEADTLLEIASETMYDMLLVHSSGQLVLHVERTSYVALLATLHADGYHMIVDLCGVDYLEHFDRVLPDGVVAERFEVVVNLINHRERARLRLRIQIPESDASLPTAFNLYAGTEAMEREAYDMFGIGFEGHPDLTRILMPEDWVGHPLRKDYDLGRIPVQFKGAPANRS